jgi:hypothetical protein
MQTERQRYYSKKAATAEPPTLDHEAELERIDEKVNVARHLMIQAMKQIDEAGLLVERLLRADKPRQPSEDSTHD